MHILAVRVGRFGDTVMMTPALNAILQYYPNAKLTVLCSPEGKLLLNDFNPAIIGIWTWDRHGLIKSHQDKKTLLKKIRAANFDIIFCFDTSTRIAELFSGIASKLYWFQGSQVLKHSARHYLELVNSARKFPIDNFYNYLPVDNNHMRKVEEELESFGIMRNDVVVMMHPTYSGYTKLGLRKRSVRVHKLWPARNYSELGNLLAHTRTDNNRSIKPIIDLLPQEISLGRKIVSQSNDSIILLEPQLNFARYKALIKRADILLSPDSGPMHIASAVGTRIVAFFSGKDPADCGPYMDPALFKILKSDDAKRGISTINVKTVFDAIISLLDKPDEGSV